MKSRLEGRPLLEIVEQFLQAENWPYQVVEPVQKMSAPTASRRPQDSHDAYSDRLLEKRLVLRMGFHGVHGTWICDAQIDEQAQHLIFYSWMGMNIAAQYRAGVLEYLTRVNFALTLGNFEMDLQNGEVRFRTSLDCSAHAPDPASLRACLYINVQSMDGYFPGVLAVVHGGLSPEAALARVARQITAA